MRFAVLALALMVTAGSAAPALADGGDGTCPRAAQAAAMSQYLKSEGSVAEAPAAQSVVPAATKPTTTTTTTPTGG